MDLFAGTWRILERDACEPSPWVRLLPYSNARPSPRYRLALRFMPPRIRLALSRRQQSARHPLARVDRGRADFISIISRNAGCQVGGTERTDALTRD